MVDADHQVVNDGIAFANGLCSAKTTRAGFLRLRRLALKAILMV